MRIYRRADFLKLPVGTAYAKGKPWYFGGINFKTENMEHDWASLDPHCVDAKSSEEEFDRLGEMLADGVSYPMQTADSRDGCYEEDDIFLVFESTDLLELQRWIAEAITASKLPSSAPLG